MAQSIGMRPRSLVACATCARPFPHVCLARIVAFAWAMWTQMEDLWYPSALSAGKIGTNRLASVATAAESSSPGSMPSAAPAAAAAAGPASREAVSAPSAACGGLDPRHHRNPQCSVWSMWRLQRLGLRTSRSPLNHQRVCSPPWSAAGPGSSVPSFSAIAGKNASAGSSSPTDALADTLLKALADAEWFEEPGFLMWDSEAEAVSKLTAGQCSHRRRRRCGAGPRRSVIGAWPSPLLQPPWQYCWISLASLAIVGRY